MLLRDRIFSLAFLSFLIFSPPLVSMSYNEDGSKGDDTNEISFTEYESGDALSSGLYSNSSDEFYEYLDENGEYRDARVEVACEDYAPANPIYVCNDVASTKSNFIPAAGICAPRDLIWVVKFRFLVEDVAADADGYEIRFYPDFLNDPATRIDFIATWDDSGILDPGGYQYIINHTYPTNGLVCTYEPRAQLFIKGNGTCSNALGYIDEAIVVWDDLSNTNIGTHDINHDVTSAGVEIDETVELCRGDNSAVRLIDSSTFNCTAAFEPEPTNENRESRWVQWVYGTFSDITTGAGATEKIIINGVSYTNADLPVYGNPTQQPSPPDVIAPNAITDNIQMPTSALIGERFEVTVRSYNTCNPYSTNNDLSPPQGGANNVFQINGPGGTEQPALTVVTGGGNFFANDVPIIRPFDIIIAPRPPLPVAVPNEVCNGSVLPNFEITAAGNVAVEWYEDDGFGSIDFLSPIPNSLPADSNSLELRASDYEPGGAINNTIPGIYNVWARYSSNTGTQNCWSEPVQTSLTIREALLTPASVSSTAGGPGFTICADGPNIVFTVDDGPPGVGVPGGAWEYDWSFGGVPLNDNLNFVTGNGGQSRTVEITNNAASGARQVRVRRRYTSAADNGDCASGRFDFNFNIDPVSIGGSLTGTNTICLGDNTGNIQLTGQTGAIQGWEVNINGGGFNLDGSLGSANPINPTPGIVGTHEYRVIVKSGICPQTVSSTVTILVNPVPPKPTITPSGPTTFCEDSNVTLSSSNINADSYQWYKDGAPIGGEVNQTIFLSTIGESGAYSVEVIGIGPTVCISPMSDPTPVLINPLPTATVAGGGSVCSGNPAPDIVWTITGTQPFTFTIIGPGGGFPINEVGYMSNTYTFFSPILGGNYEMTVLQDNNSCNATALGGSATATVIALAPPTIDSFTPGADVCDDGPATIAPVLTLDLAPNSVENYDITFNIYNSAPALVGNQTLSKVTDVAGVTTIALDYVADLGQTPDTYEVEITSIVNTGTLCNAAGLPASQFITINPRPADATNPVNSISCATATPPGVGVALSVDAPPAGNRIRWYSDILLMTDAEIGDGVASNGPDFNIFTPTLSTAATFYAVVESTTGPTNCQSNNSVAVTQTEDQQPSPADADFDDDPSLLETCTDQLLLGAGLADNNGTGTWSYSGLLYFEDFESKLDGTIVDTDQFDWARDISAIAPLDGDTHFEVRSNYFEARDTEAAEVIWISGDMDISAVANFDFSIDLAETGTHEPADHIQVYYQIDANPQQLIGGVTGDFSAPDGSFVNMSGSFATAGGALLRIIIEVQNSAITEFLRFDNITVRDATAPTISFSDINDPNATVSGLPGAAVVVPTILTWTVTSEFNVCNSSTDVVTVNRNPIPQANDPLPVLCEDVPIGNDLVTGVDLTITTYSDAITGIVGSVGRTIEYYDDAARLNPADLILDPTNVNINNGTIIYTRVIDTGTSAFTACQLDGIMTFTVNTLPVADDQVYSVCEELPAGSGISDNNNLPTLFDNLVTGGAAPRTVVWYYDPGVPINDAADIIAFGTIIPGGGLDVDGITDGTIFYGLIGNTATGCQNVASVTYDLLPRPIANPIVGQATVCASGATILYQVTNIIPGTQYVWTLPPDDPGFFQVFGGGTINDFFVLLQFPGLTAAPVPDIYNISVAEISPAPDLCIGDPQNFVIVVEDSPSPNPIIGPDPVCKDEKGVVYQVTTNNPANTFAWSISAGDAAIVGASSGVGLNQVILDFNTAALVTLEVIETSPTGCSLPAAQTININAVDLPVMTSAFNYSLCSGEAPATAPVPFVFTAVPGANNFAWEVVSVPGSITGVLLNEMGVGDINKQLFNTSGLDAIVAFEVTPTGVAVPMCVGPVQTVFITVQPEPALVVGQNATVCGGGSIAYEILLAPANLPAGTLFNWPDPDGAGPATGGINVPMGLAGTFHITDAIPNTTGAPIIISYQITPTSGAGCEGTLVAVDITVEPEPVFTGNLNATVCSDNVTGVILPANDDSAGLITSYDVGAVVGGGLTGVASTAISTGNINLISADVFNNVTNASDIVTYTVTPYFGACAGADFDIVVTVNPEPLYTGIINVSICSDNVTGVILPASDDDAGPITSYDVSAVVGGGLTGLASTAIGTGNTNLISTDVFNNVTNATDFVTYTITPYFGLCAGTNFNIVVMVSPEPLFTGNLNVTVCSDDVTGVILPLLDDDFGVITSFDVTAVKGGTLSGSATTAMGTNNINLIVNDVFNNVTSAVDFVTYTVTPYFGICVGTAINVVVTVNPEPVISNALDNTICSDATTGLVLDTNGISIGAINYNIIGITVDPSLTADLSNAGIPVSSVASVYLSNDVYTNTTNSPHDVVYEVRGVSFSACEGDSEFITITVEPAPVLDPALDATVCSDNVIGVLLAPAGGSVAAVSYNVLGITPNPSLIIGGGNVPIAIGVTANYIINDTYINTTSIPLNVIYEVKGVSAATCIGPSEFITVTIAPEPVIDPGLDKSVCSEDAVSLILNTNGVSVGATTYNVISVFIPAGLTPDAGNAVFPAVGVVDGYLSNDKYTNLTNASIIVIYEARGESASSCEGQSRFINVTIDPQPVIASGLNTTVCSDDAVGVTLATNGVSVAAASYNIIAVTPAGTLTASASNVAIPAIGVASVYFSADSYTNITNSSLAVIYEVKGVSAAGCIGNSEFITVTINPGPVVDPAITNTVCSDEIITINLGTVGTSVAAATYDVLNVTIPLGLTAGANAAIPGNAVGLGYLATDTYKNVTASPIIATYEVRGTSIAGCVGDSEFISVTINPEPVLNPALDAVSCSDEISGIVFSTNGTSVAATTYNLVSATPQAGLVPAPGNAIPALAALSTYIQNDQFTNTSNIDLIVQYVVEPVSPQNCVGAQLTILFTIHPEPVVDPGLSPSPVCSDVPSNVTLVVAAGSVAADHYNIVSITWDPALLPGGANSSIGNNQAANAIFADTYTNTSNVQKLVFYDIVPVSADNCAGDIAQVIFTIYPAPAMSNALDRTVCIDQASGIILATNGVSTLAQDYEVQSVLAPGLTAAGGNVALPVTSNNALVINGDMYNNPTDNPLTAIYTVVPISAAGCRGPVMDITLTIEPTITAVANNTLPTICSNANVDITLTSPTVPTAGNIVFNLSAVSSSPSVSGYIPVLNFLPQGYVVADFLVNSGNTPETVTYTITPVAAGAANGNGCTGESIIEVVMVNPLPLITPGQFEIVCSNTATNHTIATINNLVGTTFTWPAPTLSDPGLTGGSARGAASSAPITDSFINTTSIRQIATYNITPTSPIGCVGSIVQLNVFVDPLPIGTISVDQPVVCMNGSAILGFTITVGVAPFEIIYSDGTSDFTVSNIANSHFIAQNNLTDLTTYELKSVRDVNGCLQNLVGQTVTVTVENPVSDFTADATNDCTPLMITFTNNNIQAGTQYEWNWGDGSPLEIDNSPTITHTFINNSTVSDISYNVILMAQKTNGVVICTSMSSEFITIKATVNLNVTPSTTEGCSPLLVSFINNSQGVLANTWFWREQGTTEQNDLTNISSASFVINNPTTTPKIYEVVYQGDRNGCSDELIIEVTVHPELVADYSVAPSTVVSIIDPTITVTNNTLNKASWNHVWDWGDGQTTNAIDPDSHTYASFGVYILSLVITDPSGFCTSQKFETITVEPILPIVDFEVDFTEGCRPFTVTFTNLSTSVDPSTYLWEFRNALGTIVGTSNLENPSFTFFDAGVINVTLSGSNPLGITETVTKLALIEIYDIPTASFTVTPKTVFLPDQLLFTSNLSALADAFEWDFNGDGDIDSEEFEPQHKYELAGVYDISLIAINTTTTCTDTLEIKKAVTVVEGGVADIPNGFFPGSGNSSGGTGGNPGAPNSVFLPRLKGVRDDGFEMQIFDRWGHLIFESKDKTIGWDGRDANGKLYPVGVYVYKVDVIYVSGHQTTILGDVTLIR